MQTWQAPWTNFATLEKWESTENICDSREFKLIGMCLLLKLGDISWFVEMNYSVKKELIMLETEKGILQEAIP